MYTMKLTVLVFVQLITAVCCTNDQCRPGFIWHQHVSKCCKPIYSCEPGHRVILCTTDYDVDYCESCPPGHTSSINSSSFDIRTCYAKDTKCADDAIPNKTTGKCVCDLQNGFTGSDPALCIHDGELCPKGKQLNLDKSCGSCAAGYYKDWKGYGFCKKQISCDFLRLEYEVHGDSQTMAICKKTTTTSEDVDGGQQRTKESDTVGTQHPIVDITEKSELSPVSEHSIQTGSSKADRTPQKILFTCDLQIIIVVMGVLLFLSSVLIIYLLITKRSKLRKKKTPLSRIPIAEVGTFNRNQSQRPLPVLPRLPTYSSSENDQYIPMTASRHPSCSKSVKSIIPEVFVAPSLNDIENEGVYQSQDPYTLTLQHQDSLDDATYVKIAP